MKEQRIAVLTYHKYLAGPWPEQEFRTHAVSLANGEQVSLELAERGVRVREVRQRSESGAQSSILSTDYRSDLSRVAAAMFARWCQENLSVICTNTTIWTAWPSMVSKLLLIQLASSTLLGASSIVRSGVKTGCSAVN